MSKLETGQTAQRRNCAKILLNEGKFAWGSQLHEDKLAQIVIFEREKQTKKIVKARKNNRKISF